jgi:hypothetical protein
MVTNAQIIAKAQEFNYEITGEKWTASKGWLNKFKSRHNLTAMRIEVPVVKSHNEVIQYHEKGPPGEMKLETIDEDLMTVCGPFRTIPGGAEEVRLEITPLEAAEYLLKYITDNGSFPLKEIITLQMVRDRIAEMDP